MAGTGITIFEILIAFLLPPLAVFMRVGFKAHFWVNILFTIFGWIPGIIHALWVLLTGAGYAIFLLTFGRWGYRWLARRTGCLENGTPTPAMMTLTLVIVFISAFFTDIIGIHPIFGGFIAGVIIPHDNGYAISIVEKLEDLVSLIFIPLYFALTGLKTNLGLLNNGVTWGYTILICVVAFFSKFISCGVTAKIFGFTWRESGAVGALMSCKGLVELIVLNVGFSAGILDTRTFSMFVLHALVLTFITTPLTLLFYPEKYRGRIGRANAEADRKKGGEATEGGSRSLSHESFRTSFSVVLEKIEQIPAVMTLTQLLQLPATVAPTEAITSSASSITGDEKDVLATPPGLPYEMHGVQTPSRISIDALRLIELTNRTSAVLKSQFVDALMHSDPVLSVVRTFGYLNRMAVSTALAIVSHEDFASYISEHVRKTSTQMLILPWSTANTSVDEVAQSGSSSTVVNSFNFQNISTVQTQFFRKVFLASPTDVALFVDRGLPHTVGEQAGQHIFLPFFGGPDDRLALSFLVQLCMNPSTSATVVRLTTVGSDELTPINSIEKAQDHNTISAAFPDTVYARSDTQTRIASDTADNILWERYASGSVAEAKEAFSRITFSQEASTLPLHTVLDISTKTISQHSHSRPIVMLGRSRRLAVETHATELARLLTETNTVLASDTTKCLGDLGAAFAAKNVNASLLILQASSSS